VGRHLYAHLRHGERLHLAADRPSLARLTSIDARREENARKTYLAKRKRREESSLESRVERLHEHALASTTTLERIAAATQQQQPTPPMAPNGGEAGGEAGAAVCRHLRLAQHFVGADTINETVRCGAAAGTAHEP